MQGWRSGESTRLQPMWPGFDSQTRGHICIFIIQHIVTMSKYGHSAFNIRPAYSRYPAIYVILCGGEKW